MAQDLVGRVKRLLMSPKSEWDAIDAESVDTQKLIMGYVAPLAAIPAVAGLLGGIMFAMPGGYRLPFGTLLTGAIYQFVMAIVMVFVVAFVIDLLAPNFGAARNQKQAFKVAAYAPTAGWVSGIFALVPLLAVFTLVGAIYSLYLLFVGLPKLMKPDEGKATVYTLVAIIVAILLGVIINFVGTLFIVRPVI